MRKFTIPLIISFSAVFDHFLDFVTFIEEITIKIIKYMYVGISQMVQSKPVNSMKIFSMNCSN